MFESRNRTAHLPRQGRHMVVVFAGFLLLVALDTSIYAGTIGGTYMEGAYFVGSVLHGGIIENDQHDLTAEPLNFGGENWKFEGHITETEKGAWINDKLFVNGNVQHLKAECSGEKAPNGDKPAFEIIIQANVGEITQVLSRIPYSKGLKEHKGDVVHWDEVRVSGSVLLDADTKKDIEAYTLTFRGGHWKFKPLGHGHGILEPSGLPENAFGSAGWVVEDYNGKFLLSLAAYGISLGDVVEAQIRLGTPDEPGDIVFPLEPDSFVAVNRLGVARLIVDGRFSPNNVDDLISDNTFVEIVTPRGSLRGQLILYPVTLTPDATTVERGGTLGYTVEVTNNTEFGWTIEYWSDVYLWTGDPYTKNPVFGPKGGTLRAGRTKLAHISHKVPNNAPLKAYTLCGRIGFNPDEIWNEDTFKFTVVEPSRPGMEGTSWEMIESF